MSAAVTILQNFGCLYNETIPPAIPPNYCLGQAGPIIAYTQSQEFSVDVCVTMMEMDCCFASFQDVELAAISFNLVNQTVIPTLRELAHNCSQYNLSLATASCPGTQPNTCEILFDEISVTCLDFAFRITKWIDDASANQTTNEWLCEHPCFNTTIELLAGLGQHRKSCVESLCRFCHFVFGVSILFVDLCGQCCFETQR